MRLFLSDPEKYFDKTSLQYLSKEEIEALPISTHHKMMIKCLTNQEPTLLKLEMNGSFWKNTVKMLDVCTHIGCSKSIAPSFRHLAIDHPSEGFPKFIKALYQQISSKVKKEDPRFSLVKLMENIAIIMLYSAVPQKGSRTFQKEWSELLKEKNTAASSTEFWINCLEKWTRPRSLSANEKETSKILKGLFSFVLGYYYYCVWENLKPLANTTPSGNTQTHHSSSTQAGFFHQTSPPEQQEVKDPIKVVQTGMELFDEAQFLFIHLRKNENPPLTSRFLHSMTEMTEKHRDELKTYLLEERKRRQETGDRYPPPLKS